MKYLLFDTNIYLDMVVNRKKNINDQLIATFSALLHFGEIAMILPAIVKYETFKHLEDEIRKIENLINDPIKKIDDIYWLNGLSGDIIDASQYKNQAKQPLQELLDIFTENHNDYVLQLQETIETIFNDTSTIFIKEDSNLLSCVTKRKIYKRAPFHKESKESYADALIIEVLLNIKNYIELQEDDVIYLVTGNTSDFSLDNNHKDILHPHIMEDLKVAGLDNQTKYVNLFAKLVSVELVDEINNAELHAQFETEMEGYYDEEDDFRESVGLPSLSSFQDMMEDTVRNCDDAEKIVCIFDKINSIYSDFEDYNCSYDDEILTWLNNISEKQESTVIDAFNKFSVKFQLEYQFETFDDVISWTEKQRDMLLFEDVSLPDYISITDSISITNFEHKKLVLTWEDIELSPESGEQHTAYCVLVQDVDIIAEDRIEVTYGFMEQDENGNIGDGCDWSIEANFQNIIEALQGIYYELLKLKKKHENYIDYIEMNILKSG